MGGLLVPGKDIGLEPHHCIGEAIIAAMHDNAAAWAGAIGARPVEGLVAITMATIGAGIFLLRVIKSLLPNS